MQRIFLSLGSNVEPSETFLRKAIETLDAKYRRIDVSGIYLTAPQDYVNQPDFYNLAVCYDFTGKSAVNLLDEIHQIENDFGRADYRQINKGPRPIDIDIIYIDDFTCDLPILCIPHKAYLNRNFVLVPLYEMLQRSANEADEQWMSVISKHIEMNKDQKVDCILKF